MHQPTYKIEAIKAHPISKTDDPAAGGPASTVYVALVMYGPGATGLLCSSASREACEQAVSSHKMRQADDSLSHIEMVQGVDDDGNTFGYDHYRLTFVTWCIRRGRIAVLRVEKDENERLHGSLVASRRDAASVAARENRLPSSKLRLAIEKGLARN